MTIRLTILIALACSCIAGRAQDVLVGHVLAEVEMSGEGFMCPFLTPQVIDVLEEHAHWVEALPTLSRIRFAMPTDKAGSPSKFEALLESIGYPEGGAVFLQWDTLSTIPEAPEP